MRLSKTLLSLRVVGGGVINDYCWWGDETELLMVGVGVKDGLVRVMLMVELRWREPIGMGWGGKGIYSLTENEKARGIDCPFRVWRQ
jgi:hypothetical protein